MFVKKKPNRSGSTTVTVAKKSKGATIYVRILGTSSDADEITRLEAEARAYIREQECRDRPELDFEGAEERAVAEGIRRAEDFFASIDNVLLDAPKRILDRVFEAVGFRAVGDDIFRSLVIARLAFPSSKRATVEYLKSHFEEDYDLHKVYRYLDKLDDTVRERIQEISVRHTMKVHGGKVGVLFYDVTTLYFESDRPDELRRPGYSKDGKHSNPQIVLGLLVSGDGCPLAFAVHEGSKYEGHTMLPVVKDFTARYGLDDFVVVADSGMMNEANVRDLEESGYKYIIGARIRNMSPEVTAWVLSGEKDQSVVRSLTLDAAANKRLLVGYSEQRARLDERNRDKGLKRLRAKFASGTITKSKITQRGYNKFLRVTGNESLAVSVDEDLVESDRRWDGLKGYISNAPLPESQIIEAYHELYNVEQSFRIAKSKLEIRPIFHFNHKRIRAHISICFVALKVYRELDRLMKRNGMRISVDAALEIAKTIPTIRVKFDGGHITKTLFLTQRHKLIQPLFEDDFWGSQS